MPMTLQTYYRYVYHQLHEDTSHIACSDLIICSILQQLDDSGDAIGLLHRIAAGLVVC